MLTEASRLERDAENAESRTQNRRNREEQQCENVLFDINQHVSILLLN